MKKFAVLVAAAVMAVGAQAATVSGGSFTGGLSPTDINQSGSLSLFDSTLGTLTGASLVYGSSVTTSVTIENISPSTNQTGRGQNDVEFTWTSTNSSLAALLSGLSVNISTGPAQTYTPGQSRSFGPLSDSASNTVDLTSIIASLSGTGSFGIGCSSLTDARSVGGGGNLATAWTTSAGCNAELVYTYDVAPPPAVPEPASLALVGLALAGLAASRKSRKA